MSTEVWHVFVPHLLLKKEPSFVCGKISPGTRSVYITASTIAHTDIEHLPSGIEFIGYWSDVDTTTRRRRPSRPSDFLVDICLNKAGDVCCVLNEQYKRHQCTVIVYNPYDLLKSEILAQKMSSSGNHNDNKTENVFDKYDNAAGATDRVDQLGASADADVNREPAKGRGQADAVLSLLNVLYSTNNIFQDLQISKFTLYTVLPSNNYIGQKVMSLAIFFVNLLHFPFRWIKTDLSSASQPNNTILNTIGAPSTFAQLAGRQKSSRQFRFGDVLKPGEKLRTMNICATQFIDTLFGLVLMYILMSDNRAQYVANIGLEYGDSIANELKVLLDWLMGAPAGLKLNSQLTHILGKFFLYHIYLWSGYLVVLKPILGQLVYLCSMAGVWGMSAQLALFQDILSTMTIHIYCFYVYAARLYRLQMYALASLWRLFRGKKWNVLRERVDSAVYDVDQLFVGTLLFTVLLFILPTTGLFYIVFTLLRVFVLTMQGIVSRLRHYLNTTPWWYIVLWMQNSSSITNGAVFHLKSYTSYQADSTLVLSMQATKPSLNEIMTISKPTHTSSYSWGTILKNLFLGHLIYPWIERKPKES